MSDEPFPLGRALVKLAGLANDPSIVEDPLHIIRAGAQGQIPMCWRNSDQIWTRLSDFRKELPNTDSCSRWMRLFPEDVSKLETRQQTDVLKFALTDQDRALLGKTPPLKETPGEAPLGTTEFTDVLGVGHVTEVSEFLGEPGFRHEVSYAAVTISRDQLFVYESDLQAYAATLTAASNTTQPAPVGGREHGTPEIPDATVNPASDGAAPEPPDAPKVVTHSSKTKKKHHLAVSIEKAQEGLTDALDTTSVWANMQGLAQQKFSNLLGATEDGIQYVKDGHWRFFTRDALDKHLHPHKRGKAGNRRAAPA